MFQEYMLTMSTRELIELMRDCVAIPDQDKRAAALVASSLWLARPEETPTEPPVEKPVAASTTDGRTWRDLVGSEDPAFMREAADQAAQWGRTS